MKMPIGVHEGENKYISLTLEGYLQTGAVNYWAQILWELENCVACDWVSDPGCTPGGTVVAEKQAHKRAPNGLLS